MMVKVSRLSVSYDPDDTTKHVVNRGDVKRHVFIKFPTSNPFSCIIRTKPQTPRFMFKIAYSNMPGKFKLIPSWEHHPQYISTPTTWQVLQTEHPQLSKKDQQHK